jgi:hypothetical protein
MDRGYGLERTTGVSVAEAMLILVMVWWVLGAGALPVLHSSNIFMYPSKLLSLNVKIPMAATKWMANRMKGT